MSSSTGHCIGYLEFVVFILTRHLRSKQTEQNTVSSECLSSNFVIRYEINNYIQGIYPGVSKKFVYSVGRITHVVNLLCRDRDKRHQQKWLIVMPRYRISDTYITNNIIYFEKGFELQSCVIMAIYIHHNYKWLLEANTKSN